MQVSWGLTRLLVACMPFPFTAAIHPLDPGLVTLAGFEVRFEVMESEHLYSLLPPQPRCHAPLHPKFTKRHPVPSYPTKEGEAALEEVPKELDSARAGGLALGTLSRLLSTLELLYEGGPNGQDAVCDYRLAVQRAVRHRGEGGGGR